MQERHSAGRASPPLLFGLAPRGVCHAGDITAAAVGSYPTFSPLPAREPCRHPEGFPSVCHRVTLRRRYILCGTFRDAAACAATSPGVTRRVALHPESQRLEGFTLAPQPQSYFFTRVKWCPDFPPARPACANPASDHPAHPPIPLYRELFAAGGDSNSLLQLAVHHQRIHESQRRMLEHEGKPADNFEAQAGPELDGALIAADHKVELHASKAAFLGSL